MKWGATGFVPACGYSRQDWWRMPGVKFLLITLITHHPDPVTGEKKSSAERLREVVDSAVLAEELGFDGFAVGERHEDPFISSSPPVVLSHIAARTSSIALFTAVTTLSLLDPVRAFEDYSTLDNLSGGRLELIIGKGNGAAQAELFHVTTADQWDRNREGYELFRMLWESEQVTWAGQFRPPLVNAKGAAQAAAKADSYLARQRDEPGLCRPCRASRRPDLLRQRDLSNRALRRAGAPLPAAVGVLRSPTRGRPGRRGNRRVPHRFDVAGGGR